MPLTAAARRMVEEFEPDGHVDVARTGVDALRWTVRAMADSGPRGPELASVEDVELPGPAGPLRARVYRPRTATALPALLHLHGGGWVIGDLETEDRLCRRVARAADVAVVSLDYRLAPEHRFPAALDDADAALHALSARGRDFGIDVSRIAIGGASAGGNLAAVCARRARDRGAPTLRAQILLGPVLDRRFDTGSYAEHGHGALLTAADMRFFWDCYLGADADGDDPDAAPSRATDLSRLPPTLIVVAECSPLRDEAEAYAKRLADAGVPTVLHRADRMFHGFWGFSDVLPEAEIALHEVTAMLRSTLHAGDC